MKSNQPENRFKFTPASIASYTKNKVPADQAEHSAWDTDTKGLSIRYQYGGDGTYIIRYTIGQTKRKLKLGKVGAITLDEARKQARKALGQVGEKVDPVNERAKLSAAASVTFKPAYDGFLEKLKRERSAAYYGFTKRYLEVHFKKLHGLALATIEQSTASQALTAIEKARGPIAMNRARSAGSAFYNWAWRAGLCKHNPFEKTNKHEEDSAGRDRTLTPRELKQLWAALDDNDYGNILKLLMLTCCRRSEIGSLRRSYINWSDKLIELPGKEKVDGRWVRYTKNGMPHAVPLSPPALKILKGMEGEGEFVFGRCSGRPFTGWSKSRVDLDRKLKLPHWVLHDLRRTGETGLANLQVAPHVIDAVMNHISNPTSAKKGIRRVYNKADYIDQKTEALNKYGAWLMSVVA